MNELFDLRLWAGSDESLATYMLCLRRLVAEHGPDVLASAFVSSGGVQQPKEEDVPRLFSRAGDVGIIKVAGPLNNSDSVWNRYMGATGYPEIRAALIYGAKQEDIGAMVMDFGTGGGAVAGVFDTAQLIKTIDTKVKPIHSFTGGGMMSAGYLLGSAARTVSADQMAEVGSIGVISVHQEMSKMLKDIGITVTVQRAGEFKALTNSFEPLTEAAKKENQAHLDHMYGIFAQHVADMRGVPYDTAANKMGQGRVFIGQQAKDVGLVDSITSFDAVMSKVQGGIDSKKERSKYGANSTNQNKKGITMAGKQALTEQEIAALAEGAGAAAAAAGAPAGETVELTAEQKAAADKEAADKLAAEQAAAAAAAPSALQVVQEQLVAAQAQVTNLTIELRDANAKVKTIEGSHASMRAIAVASVNRLKVALGQTAGGAEALDDTALLAEHEALRKSFEAKFKAGGVAAVTPAASSDKVADAKPDPVRQARIAATRPR